MSGLSLFGKFLFRSLAKMEMPPEFTFEGALKPEYMKLPLEDRQKIVEDRMDELSTAGTISGRITVEKNFIAITPEENTSSASSDRWPEFAALLGSSLFPAGGAVASSVLFGVGATLEALKNRKSNDTSIPENIVHICWVQKSKIASIEIEKVKVSGGLFSSHITCVAIIGKWMNFGVELEDRVSFCFDEPYKSVKKYFLNLDTRFFEYRRLRLQTMPGEISKLLPLVFVSPPK